MSEPLHQKAYQPLGDLWIEFPKVEAVSGYRRSLNIGLDCRDRVRIPEMLTYNRAVYASHPR